MDFDDAINTFGDAPGQLTGRNLTLQRQGQKTPTHFWDDDRLQRHHAKSHQAQEDVLVQDENHRRQRLSTEEHRRDQRLADKATDRLDLVLDHRRHLRGLDVAEVRQWETQDMVEQGVAQTPQHALAQPALHGVDLELHQPADHDQAKKRQGQRKQVGNALQGKAFQQDNMRATQESR